MLKNNSDTKMIKFNFNKMKGIELKRFNAFCMACLYHSSQLLINENYKA